MKRIIILDGAGRNDGRTSALVRTFTEGAEQAGNEVIRFELQKMDIRGCRNCQGCAGQEKGIPLPCVQRDDMDEIYRAFREAQVIVLASPIYWWTVSGPLKTAVDRLYALIRNAGKDAYPKESVLLMTAGSTDYSQAVAWYSRFEPWLGWKDLGMILGANQAETARELGAGIR